MLEIYQLPTLNAVLNSLATIFLISGFIFIKKGNRKAHQFSMLSALLVSALFLTSYLIFHYHEGSVKYLGDGSIRYVYYSILITHVILAMAIVPLVLLTFSRAFQKKFELHKKIARITWPLWMYVSVTGVVIYLMMSAAGSYAAIIP